MALVLRGRESTHWLWFLSRVGIAVLAVWVAITERWDVNGDGHISAHEVLLFPVRFLAFPFHVLLSLTPSPVPCTRTAWSPSFSALPPEPPMAFESQAPIGSSV